jgi:hypothetical protein
LEMGRSDGARVNQFIQSGQQSDLAKVAIYGYRGDIGKNITDLLTGYLKWQNPQAVEEFRDQDQLFLSWLEQTSKVEEFFGFDIDTLPGGGYREINNELQKYALDPRISGFLNLLVRNPNDTVDQELNRLKVANEFLISHAQSVKTAIGQGRFDRVSADMSCLIDSFQFVSVVFPLSGGDPRIVQAMAQREHTMYRQMSEALMKIGPHEKIVLMGHSMHLSKDSDSAFFGPASASAPMWPSVGSYLNKLLPNQVASVWMIQDRGTQNDISCPDLSCAFPPTDSTYLTSYLHEVGAPVFMLPIDRKSPEETFLDQQWNFVGNSSLYNANFRKNVDLIFYVDSVNGIGD